MLPPVGTKASGRPAPSQARWSSLVSPPRDRPSAGLRNPFLGPRPHADGRGRVESTDASHSISSAASALAGVAWSVRSKAVRCPLAETRVEAGSRPVSLRHIPPCDPGSDFRAMPLRTVRSSSRGRPYTGQGGSGRTRSTRHQWRRITAVEAGSVRCCLEQSAAQFVI